MKITSFEKVLLSVPLDQNNAAKWSGGEMRVANAAIVIINTDEGITGLGDTYSGGWFYPEAVLGVIEHFESLLIGKDPRNVALLTNKMVASCQYWGRVGASINAISAIENALWDIAGKAENLPVWKLIGGLANESLPYYASAGLEQTNESLKDELLNYVKQGVPAVKIRVPTDINSAIDKVALSREILGSDIKLMVDAVMGSHPEPWNSKTALMFAKQIEQYDITWLEEPCAADDFKGLAEVRSKSSIAISGGETLFGQTEFGHLLKNHCVDIVQPDACTSGGILECLKISANAQLFKVQVAPHAWGSGATVMANLQWAFTQTNILMQEIPTWGFALRDLLMIKPLQFLDGRIMPPTEPGLGIHLTEEIRQNYPPIIGSRANIHKA